MLFPSISLPALRRELGSVFQVISSLVGTISFSLVGLQHLSQLPLAAHLVPVFGVVASLILLSGLLVHGVVGALGVVFVVLHAQTLPVSGKTRNPIIFSHRGIYTHAPARKKRPPTRSLHPVS